MKQENYAVPFNGTMYFELTELQNLSEYEKIKLIMLLARENKRLLSLAYQDQLTGLQNRRSLNRQVDSAIINQESFAVVLGDVDQFKQINDKYGHIIGDKVLAEIGKTLLKSIRDDDIAVRFGGDEFQLLLRNCTLEDAKKKVAKIKAIVEQNILLRVGLDEAVTMSFGISFCDQKEVGYQEALRQADESLYESKKNLKNSINTYKRERKI